MPWQIVDKVAFVDGKIAVNIKIDFTKYQQRIPLAQQMLGNMVLASCQDYMPLLTGSLRQRSYVDPGGHKVVFPGPYARYQYGGVVMVDSVTGKGPAKYVDKNGVDEYYRYRKGAVLKPTKRRLIYSQPNAQSHWFAFAKVRDLQAWIAGCDRIIKGGSV